MDNQLQVRSFIGASKHREWADLGFHHHATLEISILLEGQGVFEWSEQKLSLEMGHVVIIPAMMSHRFEGRSSRYGLIHMEKIPPSLMKLLDELLNGAQPKIILLSRLDKERYELIFRQWLRIYASPLKNAERNYKAWLEVIVLFLLEHSQTSQEALTVVKAADFIRENLSQRVQMADLAALSGWSEAGFRRMFEETYHMSPKQYQQQCRMTEAKWLLGTSNKTVNEIASQIGFERLHSFSEWFKKSEGLSPSEWRKREQRQ